MATKESALAKIAELESLIEQMNDEKGYNQFSSDWGEHIDKVNPLKKKVFGDEWDEGKSLYERIKQSRKGGVSEDSIKTVLTTYFTEQEQLYESLAAVLNQKGDTEAAQTMTEMATEMGEAAEEVQAQNDDEDLPEDYEELAEEKPNFKVLSEHLDL
ncbi:hypothetical protein FACS1894172_09340 [Spirochaetia bacterium]|nr:hypothetical protein FACS1894164_11580 [Spirochaetia bacterium]GHU32539.1 hypothetical protein FACS1894172_09340 [Spirochaetia bacterium]